MPVHCDTRRGTMMMMMMMSGRAGMCSSTFAFPSTSPSPSSSSLPPHTPARTVRWWALSMLLLRTHCEPSNPQMRTSGPEEMIWRLREVERKASERTWSDAQADRPLQEVKSVPVGFHCTCHTGVLPGTVW